MTHFFISYAKKDTQLLAFELCDIFESLPNMSAWVDRSLIVGRSWEGDIQREIRKCDYFIVLYSPDINRHLYDESAPESYVLEEIAYARYTLNKQIIPVMAQNTEAPMGMTRLQYINFAAGGMSIRQLVNRILQETGLANTITEQQTIPLAPKIPVVESPKVEVPKTSTLELALARARDFRGTKNTDWQPIIMKLGEIEPNSPIPDVEMCLVPVGKFMMGGDGQYDGKPIHEQKISQPYWIARYPVTNAQWRVAAEAGAVNEPADTTWYNDKSMADCPVVYVDWFQSLEFAGWLNCNLPTEPLWEYAARGIENWIYPWGNDWEDGKRVVWSKNSNGKPNPVSNKPEGSSWVGAQHLSGNVWEWQLSAYRDYDYVASDGREGDFDNSNITRSLRGASWGYNYTNFFRAACRDGFIPASWNNNIGFRVSRFNLGF